MSVAILDPWFWWCNTIGVWSNSLIAGFDPRPWEEHAPSFTVPMATEWEAALRQVRGSDCPLHADRLHLLERFLFFIGTSVRNQHYKACDSHSIEVCNSGLYTCLNTTATYWMCNLQYPGKSCCRSEFVWVSACARYVDRVCHSVLSHELIIPKRVACSEYVRITTFPF